MGKAKEYQGKIQIFELYCFELTKKQIKKKLKIYKSSVFQLLQTFNFSKSIFSFYQ